MKFVQRSILILLLLISPLSLAKVSVKPEASTVYGHSERNDVTQPLKYFEERLQNAISKDMNVYVFIQTRRIDGNWVADVRTRLADSTDSSFHIISSGYSFDQRNYHFRHGNTRKYRTRAIEYSLKLAADKVIQHANRYYDFNTFRFHLLSQTLNFETERPDDLWAKFYILEKLNTSKLADYKIMRAIQIKVNIKSQLNEAISQYAVDMDCHIDHETQGEIEFKKQLVSESNYKTKNLIELRNKTVRKVTREFTETLLKKLNT